MPDLVYTSSTQRVWAAPVEAYQRSGFPGGALPIITMQSSNSSSTLKHVTKRKLNNLAIQFTQYEKSYDIILGNAYQEKGALSSLGTLLQGIEHFSLENSVSESSASRVPLSTIQQIFNQAKNDPNISASTINRWKLELEGSLKAIREQYRYAELIGRLVSEWAEQSTTPSIETETEGAITEHFESIGFGEMHEQQRQWESFAFSRKETDPESIKSYLDGIFEPSKLRPAEISSNRMSSFEKLFKDISSFGNDSQMLTISPSDVRWCIEGILRQDLYSGHLRQGLKDMLQQYSLLQEMADVLNQDLGLLEEWKWENEPLDLHMRRAVNGKYRVYMNEEYHQAILLHFVGSKWSSHLKACFQNFFNEAWTHSSQRPMSRDAKRRRSTMFGSSHRTESKFTVNHKRKIDYKEKYWLAQLQSSGHSVNTSYDFSEDSYNNTNTKQEILRLVTTEMLVALKVYGKFAVVQSDFEWFGPSLPHSTIKAILSYIGIGDTWVNFFIKFLQPRVAFAHDGIVHDRVRGIPMSHEISTLIGEAILFCLDTAVNLRTNGGYLYRVHDDLWFWGQQERCQLAWSEIVIFANVMGLNLNREKTGSALLQSGPVDNNNLIDVDLPTGPVRWGFLALDTSKHQWMIDTSNLDKHTEAFRRQLEACPSVFGKIRAWNAFAEKFVSNNFGRPARCFLQDHATLCLKAFARIQIVLFSTEESQTNRFEGNNAIVDHPSMFTYLRNLLSQRFGSKSFPDGFFFFPTKLGGLGIRNPAIESARIIPQLSVDPARRILDAFCDDEDEYEKALDEWENSSPSSRPWGYQDEPFMSREEAMRYREDTSRNLRAVYDDMLKELPPAALSSPSLDRFKPKDKGAYDSATSFTGQLDYWEVILQMYGDEILKQFGSLQIVNPQHLPLGAMETLSSEKVRWQN